MGLFSRKRDGGDAAITRLYYASDIHGSEVLWRKFLNAAQAYRADVLVMGGDLTGKVVIPFVERPDGIEVELFGERHVLPDPEQVAEMADRVRANGMYPYEMSAAISPKIAPEAPIVLCPPRTAVTASDEPLNASTFMAFASPPMLFMSRPAAM